MAAHEQTLRIYYQDTDATGVVFHPNYLAFAERGRVDADPVCSGTGGDNGAHGRYIADGLTDQAADFAVSKLPRGGSGRPVPPPAPAPVPEQG